MASSPDAVLYEYINVGIKVVPIIVGRIYQYAGARQNAVLYEYILVEEAP